MIIQKDEIIIKLSKFKIVLLTIGAISFVMVSLWLLSIADHQTLYDSMIVDVVACIAIGFFGLCGVYGLVKIFDRKPGLIINRLGLIDNSSALSGKLIKWEEITEFKIVQVKSTKFLLIFVKNPQEFLDNANKFKRFWMNMNERMYGTPLSISSNSLQCSFDELIEIINNEMEKYGFVSE